MNLQNHLALRRLRLCLTAETKRATGEFTFATETTQHDNSHMCTDSDVIPMSDERRNAQPLMESGGPAGN